jgi:hypothetical protein
VARPFWERLKRLLYQTFPLHWRAKLNRGETHGGVRVARARAKMKNWLMLALKGSGTRTDTLQSMSAPQKSMSRRLKRRGVPP